VELSKEERERFKVYMTEMHPSVTELMNTLGEKIAEDYREQKILRVIEKKGW